MNTNKLPSGISITQAKKYAKRLKKARPELTHTEALNFILKENGCDKPLNKVLAKARSLKEYPGTQDPHRNLLVLATNYLIRQSLISLEAPNDYDERRRDPSREGLERGHVNTVLAGKKSVINWNDVGFEEFRISVWWDYDHSKHPQANHEGSYRERFVTASPLAKRKKFKDFVGVVCSGWFERKEGKYLQGRGKTNLHEIYTRQRNAELLRAIPKTKCLGFSAEGPFHL